MEQQFSMISVVMPLVVLKGIIGNGGRNFQKKLLNGLKPDSKIDRDNPVSESN